MARIEFAGEASDTESSMLESLGGYTVRVTTAPTSDRLIPDRFDAQILGVERDIDWTDGTVLRLQRVADDGEPVGAVFSAAVHSVYVY